MKRFLIIATATLAGILAAPPSAEAGRVHASFTYRSGCAPCGCAIYTRRELCGYDHYRRPIYRYASLPLRHSCRAHVRVGPRSIYYFNGRICRPVAGPPPCRVCGVRGHVCRPHRAPIRSGWRSHR